MVDVIHILPKKNYNFLVNNFSALREIWLTRWFHMTCGHARQRRVCSDNESLNQLAPHKIVMLKKSKNLDRNNLDRNSWKIVHFDTFWLHGHLGAKISYNMGELWMGVVSSLKSTTSFMVFSVTYYWESRNAITSYSRVQFLLAKWDAFAWYYILNK